MVKTRQVAPVKAGVRRKPPVIKPCPMCCGGKYCQPVTKGMRTDDVCLLCRGAGFIPDEKCACGRPRILIHPKHRVAFCGYNENCIPKIEELEKLEKAVAPEVKPQQSSADDEYAEYLLSLGMDLPRVY